MKGDMYFARSSRQEILERAECGGAVTSLLKFALESKRVDAVLTVEPRNGNRFDGIPVLLTEPARLIETSGTLHYAYPNIARFLKEYLDGAFDLKVAVVVKPCDVRAIIELAKRGQINIENLLLIGLNCVGTMSPAVARKMFEDEFGVDPDDVIEEDIEDGKLTVRLVDGTEKQRDLAELEEKGYGRRDNCRRCEINIPIMADIACGKWGTADKNTTFVEVCSEKGDDLVNEAIKAGCIEVETPISEAIEIRKEKGKVARELALKWQERDFATFKQMTLDERFDYWSGEFSRCIKCYGCRDECPICYCKDCYLEADRGLVRAGEVPPEIMFPFVRIAHVMDSCVNCGRCQDVCPMGLPLACLTFMLNRELADIFEYEPGMDVNDLPPLRTAFDEELAMEGVELK